MLAINNYQSTIKNMYNPAQPITNTKEDTKRKINLKPILIILVTFLLYFLTLISTTILANFSENIISASLSNTFDPLITIAYILVFYSVSFYYSLTKKQAYNYLLLAIFLSFTISFVEGSMVLIFLAPLLRKLKLIEQAQN